MEAPPSNSESDLQLSTTRFSTTAAAAAWHVLGLLLSYGRPALTSELATIFDSTPEFIRFLCSIPSFLCSIPNSPLRFADNHLVTFSPVGVANIAKLRAHSDVVIRYLDLPQVVPRPLAHVRSNEIVMTYCRKRKRPTLDTEDFQLTKKKNHFIDFNDEENQNLLTRMMPDGFQNVCAQGIETPSSSSSIMEYDSAKLDNIIFGPAMFTKSSFEHVCYEIENVEHEYHEVELKYPNREGLNYLHQQSCKSCSFFQGIFQHIHKVDTEEMINPSPLPQLSLSPHIMENSEGSKFGGIDIVNPINSNLEVDEQMIVSHEQNEAVVQGSDSLIKDVSGKGKEVWSHDFGRHRGHKENKPMNIPFADRSHLDKPEKTLSEDNTEALFAVRPRTEGHHQSQGDTLSISRYSSITKPDHKDKKHDIKKAICPTMENGKLLPDKGLQQGKKHKNLNVEKQHMKLNRDLNMNKVKRELFAEKGKKASSTFKNHIEQKSFPDFESFIVEEEEGSGGYGTVYRARRKSDGVTFAIKSPHDNANRNYVINEMKMLERLRGKNFVIRYEGSFKSGSADCLVLEHVEHDRPETLKREIDIIHLQWYGYCLFKALAGLHKQGIVHRDVKPGNFLYSRKANKGYLIDFNLALDLHKKHGTVDNSKAGHNLNEPVRVTRTNSIAPAKNKKIMNTRFSEAVKGNPGKASTSVLPPGNLKKKVDKAKVLNDASRNIIKSQGGDGSGITSAKDGTSNKTQSAERFREPIPSQGRRELLSLVQEARQGEHYESVTAPISKRKRVAASPGDAESFFLHPTPMPLHASGIGIRGAGLMKSKGDGKPKREGPCAGTKGFKAPEVLFRSLHQGPKADIWSAGVTLLYLMIGRAPFTGDTDQNIKEIAKLRGSEDLWEVAKLHNHESLFPMDLLDVKYLSSTKLRDWCARNTRRPDFLEAMPRSLFDLVDKCLMVNPRHRINADEALGHEFFWPCHDILRKSRAAKARDI